MPTPTRTRRRIPGNRMGVVLCAVALILFGWVPGRVRAKLHKSIIAGSWYPGNAQELRDELARLFAGQAPPNPDGRLVALVVPHAGYRYSGAVAACAYRLLRGRHVRTAVIVAPSHRVRFPGVSVYDQGGYQTPLGVVAIDRGLIRAIQAADSQVHYRPEAHQREHSLEIQLPFLQYLDPAIRIVPLVMGEQSWNTCSRLATAIAAAVRGRQVILIASTDLSHYHPAPEARRLDSVLIARVRRLDPEGLYEKLALGECEACGGGPLVTVLLAARQLGADHVRILRYSHSGKVTGDDSAVVGYLAAALVAGAANGPRRGADPKAPPGPGDRAPARLATAADSDSFHLSARERSYLLHLARSAIEAACSGKPEPAVNPPTQRLKQPAAAFVTLTRGRRLRGCIGHIVARDPLARTVAAMAVAAAVHDPRFPPVTSREVPGLHIEISVLTPLRRIDDPTVIKVGHDGIFIRRGYLSGLLLPQVAVEFGWDRRTFLEQTCRKAGLEPNAWKDPGTEIYVFQAQVFGEARPAR